MFTMKELNRMSPTAVRRYALQLQERVAELEAQVVAKPVVPGALPIHIVDGIVQIGDRKFIGEVGTYANGARFVRLGDRITVREGHHVPDYRIEEAVAAGFLHEPLP